MVLNFLKREADVCNTRSNQRLLFVWMILYHCLMSWLQCGKIQVSWNLLQTFYLHEVLPCLWFWLAAVWMKILNQNCVIRSCQICINWCKYHILPLFWQLKSSNNNSEIVFSLTPDKRSWSQGKANLIFLVWPSFLSAHRIFFLPSWWMDIVKLKVQIFNNVGGSSDYNQG